MNVERAIIRIRPGWWTLILITAVIAMTLVCTGFFLGAYRSYMPVTLTSDRTGLVMESGAKVKMRGVDVGRVEAIGGGSDPIRLQLQIDSDQVRFIPANVQAEIKATTIFGAKYVELTPPPEPSAARLSSGTMLRTRNVSTEVNTVFENLVGILKQIDVAKLNATLTALADGVRGQGSRIGEAITDANQVLAAINPRMPTVRQNWRSLKGFSDAYGAAAHDIVAILDSAATTSTTLTDHARDLDALLLNTIGLSQDGIALLASSRNDIDHAVNALAPTTDLLAKYSPEYTCLLTGARSFLDNGGYDSQGGADGRSIVVDAAFLLGKDPYRYPDNLPIVAAKGGPGGKPGCGSLPDASKNFPVRQLITNTGWGTGLDVRPNPGIGHPWWIDFFPVTRGAPEPPSIHGQKPPAIGPVPYPGAPPYGAPLYGADGTPLYPGVPPAPTGPQP